MRDVCLLIYTLEAIFQLTELGEEPCSGIANVHRSVEILINLLTVDPNLYGKEALQGLKLVTIHDPDSLTSPAPPPQPVTTPSPGMLQATPQRTAPPTVLVGSAAKQMPSGVVKAGAFLYAFHVQSLRIFLVAILQF